MPTLHYDTATVGDLLSVTADVRHEGSAAMSGFAQPPVVLTFDGEDDTITLEVGRNGYDSAHSAAKRLRMAADELDRIADTWEPVPLDTDAYVTWDRDGWYLSIEGQSVYPTPHRVQRGVTEAGALVLMELEQREQGVFPPTWLDRHGRGQPDLVKTEGVLEAALEVRKRGIYDEPVCRECGEPIELDADGDWTHTLSDLVNSRWVEVGTRRECEDPEDVAEDETAYVADLDLGVNPADLADLIADLDPAYPLTSAGSGQEATE